MAGMIDVLPILSAAGPDATLVGDVQALAEETTPDGRPRHAGSVMAWLARVLVGRADGTNPDMPLLELAHLLLAVDRVLGPAGRVTLFLSVAPVTPTTLRAALEPPRALGRTRVTNAGVDLLGTGQSGEPFSVAFGRMPRLLALYGFLVSMDGYRKYEAVNALLDTLRDGPGDAAAVRTAANGLAGLLRDYRKRHLVRSGSDARFDRIRALVRDRHPDTPAGALDCADILALWREAAPTDESFRTYENTVRVVLLFLDAVEAIAGRAALAASDDTEPDHPNAAPPEGADPWTDPLPALDDHPVSAVKVLKGSEARALRFIARLGPRARALPLTWARLESFAPVQSAISNDLRVGRPVATVRARLDCTAARTYTDVIADHAPLLDKLRQVRLACLHALMEEDAGNDDASTVVAFPGARGDDRLDTARQAARKAWQRTQRAGFRDAALTPDENQAAFTIGADVLDRLIGRIEALRPVLKRLDRQAPDWSARFSADRAVFAAMFHALYDVSCASDAGDVR